MNKIRVTISEFTERAEQEYVADRGLNTNTKSESSASTNLAKAAPYRRGLVDILMEHVHHIFSVSNLTEVVKTDEMFFPLTSFADEEKSELRSRLEVAVATCSRFSFVIVTEEDCFCVEKSLKERLLSASKRLDNAPYVRVDIVNESVQEPAFGDTSTFSVNKRDYSPPAKDVLCLLVHNLALIERSPHIMSHFASLSLAFERYKNQTKRGVRSVLNVRIHDIREPKIIRN